MIVNYVYCIYRQLFLSLVYMLRSQRNIIHAFNVHIQSIFLLIFRQSRPIHHIILKLKAQYEKKKYHKTCFQCTYPNVVIQNTSILDKMPILCLTHYCHMKISLLLHPHVLKE